MGDFKRTVVGECSVIMVRTADGSISVVENVCAHCGMQFCRQRQGHVRAFVCPYHQWSYKLNGQRRGVQQGGETKGGMPADFNTAEHGLTRLRGATRGGLVLATFDHDMESLKDFIGPAVLACVDRLFNGRPLPGHRGAHTGRAEVCRAAVCVRQRDGAQGHQLPHLTRFESTRPPPSHVQKHQDPVQL